MRKIVTTCLLSLFLLTGCSQNSFINSKPDLDYRNTEEQDEQFLEAIKSSGKTNNIFSDEEYIKYAKVMCTLIDHTKDPGKLVAEYQGEDQIVSDAAIQIYCPHHLDAVPEK